MANDAFKKMHGRRMEAKYGNKEDNNKEDNSTNKTMEKIVERELSRGQTATAAVGVMTGKGSEVTLPGAKIGEKLKGAYEVRQIRKGQIKYAGQTIRETTRDRENPEIDKGGPEYDD